VEPEWGESLTRWTVRLAVACVFARVVVDLLRPGQTWQRLARGLWTAGCGLYLLHVAAAFQFFHSWSHDAAYRSTAEQTKAMTGLAWGGGLWLNYLFTALWCADVGLWWLAPRRHAELPSVVRRAYAGWFAFIALNATVVFGPAFWKPLGVAAALALGILLIRRPPAGRY
jgi:hypothetical protein